MRFYMPTQVIMEDNCIANNSALIKSFGKKAMLVTGKSSAIKNGSQADVVKVLNENGQEYVVYNDIMTNPTVECAYEGAAFAKENKVDFVIAIGGGSPMDAAKAIALLARQDIKKEELFAGNYTNDVLPMIFIPTTAGTGSEVTPYSILTNTQAQTKTSIATPVIFPKVALLDSKYMDSLPLTITINTAIDALSHAVEGMLSIKASSLTDAIAAESIQTISGCFDEMIAGGISPDCRKKLLYASTLAGIVIAHTGTTAVHSMGYSLTYFKDIDHGRANGLLLPEFLKLVCEKEPVCVNRILDLMGFKSVEEYQAVTDKLLKEKEVLTLDEAEQFSTIAIKAKNIMNCKVVPAQVDLLNIYKKVFAIK